MVSDDDFAATAPNKRGESAAVEQSIGDFVVPAAGTPAPTVWCANSTHAADHAAAGDVEGAMRLLNRQIAAVHFVPLKRHMMALLQGAHASVPAMAAVPPLRSALHRNLAADKPIDKVRLTFVTRYT